MLTKLLLSVREAAYQLGVSPRHLFSLTAPRGPIPAIRLGKRVMYRPQDLEAFLQRAAQRELERAANQESAQAAQSSPASVEG